MQPAATSSDAVGLRGVIWHFALAATTVFGLFAWQGNAGFDLGDEGYLWYGAKQVMQGAVPMRDFMSYDPGRYYWSAAFMGLWGDDGIMSLRYAVAIFQAAALLVAIELIARTERRSSVLFVLLAVLALASWMLPRTNDNFSRPVSCAIRLHRSTRSGRCSTPHTRAERFAVKSR